MSAKKKLLTPEEVMEKAQTILQPWAVSNTSPEANRLDVVIAAKDIKACTKAILENDLGYLAAITGLDDAEYALDEVTKAKTLVPDRGQVEVLYHFCKGPVVTTLRVALPYEKVEIDSICDILPSATLYERETMELLGVNFVGTPSTDKLLLPDSWPEGVYPLRKAFTGLPKANES